MTTFEIIRKDGNASVITPNIFFDVGGFLTNVWDYNEPYPTLKPLLDSYPLVFDGVRLQGDPEKDSRTYLESTYKEANWDMEKVWYIKEAVTRPSLLYRAVVDLGDPLTHSMNHMYVIPHINGTMNYMGVRWKSRGAFFSFPNPPAQGVLGQEVTYSIPDSDLNARIVHEVDGEIDVTWFASGVRDVNGAGGFSTYNDQKRRTITVGNQASAIVNFYFTQPQWVPSVNYKLSISTPDGIVDVSVGSDYANAIRFSVTPDIQLGLPVVELDDGSATQVHIAMSDGIKALKAYVPYKDIPMLED